MLVRREQGCITLRQGLENRLYVQRVVAGFDGRGRAIDVTPCGASLSLLVGDVGTRTVLQPPIGDTSRKRARTGPVLVEALERLDEFEPEVLPQVGEVVRRQAASLGVPGQPKLESGLCSLVGHDAFKCIAASANCWVAEFGRV